MRIGLHDAEMEHFRKTKTFPNLAIMKLSAYYKAKGCEVEWWKSCTEYDKVYSSKVFSFSKENSQLTQSAIKGGTGYDIQVKLHVEIESCFPDYTLYPACDYAVGFTTRGCINNCDFCIVPKKEGHIHACGDWQDIVRKDTNKLVLLDNNILASEHGIRQLEGLSKSAYCIDLNQGMDITLIDDAICRILKQINWIQFIRFSCDRVEQLPYFVKLNKLFKKHNLPASRVFVYMLIRDDLKEAEHRVMSLHQINSNFSLYAQAEHKFDNTVNGHAKQFARFVYGRVYKKACFMDFIGRNSVKAL
jgi:hypothetical protein